MKCKYLNQFRLPDCSWAVESCLANEGPYAPSISELQDYCNTNGFIKCPVLMRKESICVDNSVASEKLAAA